jgi:hypothetical protein
LTNRSEEDDFDKKFSEIMELSNIEDLDTFIKTEAFQSIKENILLLNALNELSQEINSIIMCIINESPINLTEDMQDTLSTIYKLSIDFVDDMVELNSIGLELEFDSDIEFDSYDDEEEEDED